ncbi:cytochrome c oxidase subunit 8A, mitochondrial-like [Erinaceus europaeus]|uniref:Cytochrome c oxidase subunit 8 n=1 Tax=Erinaceus europaeus TaxID=9365 RepID=A0ABM3XKP0_ERIEU|nr:cytochrome c oxidase subunit 8A, mitochondrial-like [Erinaceus europaeus]
MSVFTQLLLRGLAWRVSMPRAQVHSKPLREQLGIMDKAIGLTSCFLCFLLPGGWMLSHLENYKRRE